MKKPAARLTLTPLDRARGALLGLAVGDAFGGPYETKPAHAIPQKLNFRPLTSDDTSMAIALGESIVEQKGFVPDAVAAAFVRWYLGKPRGIGSTTRKSLQRMHAGWEWSAASRAVYEEDPARTAGNGGLMRVAPLAISCHDELSVLAHLAAQSCQITHTHPQAIGATVAGAVILGALLSGTEFRAAVLLAQIFTTQEMLDEEYLRPFGKPASEISGSGYAPDTLAAALWAASQATGQEALELAVRLGGDTDTVAAVTGAFVGARDGVDVFPQAWRDALPEQKTLETLARSLL